MHIKRIVIQGFKTYKNTTTIDDLSPGHNVVVGRNGSGKSNFFAAIRFVLSDQYTRMSKEERQGLIHEGSGTVLSAFVEIVFDNSDGRFPTGKSEVVIRRTIGLKKDDYSLDYKSSTRTDVMQLLESAGFSKSNPYYIVPQGRITALTNAKDQERLNLLKEVAGAKVFENKLKESQKEMTKTKTQRDKIDEMLEFIQERLADLDSEKDELKKFQDLERDKKVFEFILYDRELKDVTTSIEEIDSEYQNAVENSHKFVEDLEKRENLVVELNKSIDSTKHEIKLLNIDLEQHLGNVNDISKSIYEKNAVLFEMSDNFDSQQQAIKNNKRSAEKLQGRIDETCSLIASKRPKVEQLKESEKKLRSEIASLKTRQNLLYSKQGRYSMFNNRTERNSWLESQIQEMSMEKSIKQEEITKNEKLMKELRDQYTILTEQIDDLQDSINGPHAQSEIQEIEEQIATLRQQYTYENDQRKTLWRDENRCKTILDSLTDEMNKAERQVGQTMDRQLANGLQAVKRITQRLCLNGVYGPLGELIEVNQKYRTAVEVIAGNSLFHVIVDNDDTATALMEELIREKGGRVTFVPLNRLKVKDQIYPESSDCVPLIKKIGFDTAITAAVKQCFGKTIVTVDLERGYELSKQFKLTAITLDGDKADRKGVLTGGYYDFRKSRLEALKAKQDKTKEFSEQEYKLFKIKTEIDNKGQEILRISNELTALHTKYDQLVSSKSSFKSVLSNKLNEKFKIQESISLLDEQTTQQKTVFSASETKIAELQREKESAFEEGLSAEEKNELNSITTNLSQLSGNMNRTIDELLEEEGELTRLTLELKENLQPRLQDILKRQQSTAQAVLEEDIANLDKEIAKLQKDLQDAEYLADEIQTKINDKNLELKKVNESLTKADEQQRKLVRTLENFQRNSEKYLSKRQIMTKRRDDTQAKVRQLGTLPDAAFNQSFDYDNDELLKRLSEVTKGLEKFSHVNRKALEQYLNFTKQRDSLVERRKELDKSEESILDLMNHLSERKNEAIDKTFKQVSKAFTEVFEKLVPKGFGHLVMQSRSKNTQAEQDEDEDVEMDSDENDSDIDNYMGVSIQVSFNSKSDEQQRIEQLSGGQKSLCAIALILAIQKSDPAPFYLFDEIDANLDTQYRTAVANLIHELSAGAQFVCTTFRPEMLQVANKFFGVMFNNKISSVSEISQIDALGFVEGQQQRS
jgi:structural maintenance of chromosome 3 (chondroitin sulfate proteoglycan 6)